VDPEANAAQAGVVPQQSGQGRGRRGTTPEENKGSKGGQKSRFIGHIAGKEQTADGPRASS